MGFELCSLRTLDASNAASSLCTKNSSSYIASMTEMELATSAQCVSITLFRLVSAATWSWVCSSSSMLNRPEALPKGTPDIGTGPATLMVPARERSEACAESVTPALRATSCGDSLAADIRSWPFEPTENVS